MADANTIAADVPAPKPDAAEPVVATPATAAPATAQSPSGSNDASSDYTLHRQQLFGKTEEMRAQEWLRSNGGPVDIAKVPNQPDEQSKPLEPFPTDRPPPPRQSTAGKVMRNIGEVIPQAVHGVEEAVYNTFGPFNSVVAWMNEHWADLRYETLFGKDPLKDRPETIAGGLAHELSQFFLGFNVATKSLQAAGLAGKIGTIGTTVAASAMADFAVRDPHGERLANLWQHAGLPQSMLSDWLAADPNDSAMEGRFKSAVESVFTGLAAEGLIKVATAYRGALKVAKAQRSEKDLLREKYGEISDADRLKIVGDTSRPLIEGVRKPVTSSTDATGSAWKVEAVALKEGDKPLYFKITDANGRELAHADFIEEGGKLTSESVIVDKSLKGRGIAEMLYRSASEQTGMPIVPGRMQTPEGAKFVSAMQSKGVIQGGTKVSDQAAAEAIIGGRGVVKAGDQELYINFARIDKPEDVQNVIATMAQRHKGAINEATRGKITQEETIRLADDLGMTVEQLTSRRIGQPLNAEQTLAARQLWGASAQNLLKLSKAASQPNAGELDQFAFRRAMATHAAIQSEVIGARTETARALASWRIPAGDGVEQARAIRLMMEEAGGFNASREMASKLSILADNLGSTKGLAQFAEKGWGAKSFDVMKELWVNWMLFGPSTHAVNMVSNTAVMFQSVAERGLAAKIGQVMGTEGGVAPGEALAMAYGTMQSIKSAFVLSARALRTGETGMGMGKVELPRVPSISTEALGMSSDTGLGRMVDFLGSVNRAPTKLLMAEDEFAKTVGYQAELHALALRQATSEGKAGKELWSRMKEIVLDPPPELKINAADAALYRTFTDPVGKIGHAIMSLRESTPAAFFIFPFVRTPVRIANYTFERSPFAPLMSSFRADVSAGGARRDLALARMSIGTGIMAAALDWADSGLITGRGPKNAGERESQLRQNWGQYSVRIGDHFFDISRLDPYGAQLGFAADVAEMIRSKEIGPEDEADISEIMTMGIAAVSQVAINKTYLRGASDFFAMMNDGQRYGPQYIRNLLGTLLVPAGGLAGSVERVVDPIVREQRDLLDSARAKLIGLSDKLPPKMTLWGDQTSTESGLGKVYDLLSPARAREIKPIPVDMEIKRLSPLAAAANVEGGFLRIPKTTTFMGVQVSFKDFPDAYVEYTRLAGNGFKDPDTGLGAKDMLNEVVQGKGKYGPLYARLPDVKRIEFISNTIAKYRRAAQATLFNDPKYADFRQSVMDAVQIMQNRAAQAPVGVVGQ